MGISCTARGLQSASNWAKPAAPSLKWRHRGANERVGTDPSHEHSEHEPLVSDSAIPDNKTVTERPSGRPFYFGIFPNVGELIGGLNMRGFRRFIIKIAEVLTILTMVFLTISFAISGMFWTALGGYSWISGLVLGAISGFAVAALGAAILFLLIEIAENTRRIP
jgi:hypothetical protein